MVLQTFSQPTRWFYKHSLFSPAVWSANQMVFTLIFFTCCVVSQPDGVYTHCFHLLCGQPTRWCLHSLFSPAVWSANQMVFTLTFFTAQNSTREKMIPMLSLRLLSAANLLSTSVIIYLVTYTAVPSTWLEPASVSPSRWRCWHPAHTHTHTQHTHTHTTYTHTHTHNIHTHTHTHTHTQHTHTHTHKVDGKPSLWSPLLTDVVPLPHWRLTQILTAPLQLAWPQLGKINSRTAPASIPLHKLPLW